MICLYSMLKPFIIEDHQQMSMLVWPVLDMVVVFWRTVCYSVKCWVCGWKALSKFLFLQEYTLESFSKCNSVTISFICQIHTSISKTLKKVYICTNVMKPFLYSLILILKCASVLIYNSMQPQNSYFIEFIAFLGLFSLPNSVPTLSILFIPYPIL